MSAPKARVLSNNAVISVKDGLLFGPNIPIGELDGFTATSTTSLLKFRPIGTAIETAQLKYGGYDLSFDGGKVDWELARRYHAMESVLRSAGDNFLFEIEQKITYYDGTEEIFTYNDVVLFGYSLDAKTGEELKEKVSGYAPQRNIIDAGVVTETIIRFAEAKAKKATAAAIDSALNVFDLF